jgi:hypothetical protein
VGQNLSDKGAEEPTYSGEERSACFLVVPAKLRVCGSDVAFQQSSWLRAATMVWVEQLKENCTFGRYIRKWTLFLWTYHYGIRQPCPRDGPDIEFDDFLPTVFFTEETNSSTG